MEKKFRNETNIDSSELGSLFRWFGLNDTPNSRKQVRQEFGVASIHGGTKRDHNRYIGQFELGFE